MNWQNKGFVTLPASPGEIPGFGVCERRGRSHTPKPGSVLTESRKAGYIFALIILLLSLAACDGELPVIFPADTATPTPTATITSTATPTPTPTPTPIPLAARVNGEAITLAVYSASLAQYQSANGVNLASEEEAQAAEQIVMEDLIHKTLLAQGAAEMGFVVDEAMLETRLERLAEAMGGASALANWRAAQGYSEESFGAALRREIAAAWMRDEIAAAVPERAEQIHARQILHYNLEQANATLAQLNNGADFETLAVYFDPVAGGDLLWFPRGYLNVPELDEPVFALQPGQFTAVIETRLGFHIVQVLEREADRLLSLNARSVLQAKALAEWLAERRAASVIEILLP